MKGYGKYVYEGEKIGTIAWDEINVAERDIEEPFPDIDRDRMFGLVIYSSMTISQESCYEFSLTSDDGSKLWIDSQLILDNDKNHEMRLLRDTIGLESGTYKIKIWYHQAYPDQYGFIFDAQHTEEPCSDLKIEKPKPPKSIKFTLNEAISFAKNEFSIKDSAKPKLDSIAQLILRNQPRKVNIVGHTDNTGSAEFNKELSNKIKDLACRSKYAAVPSLNKSTGLILLRISHSYCIPPIKTIS